MIETLVTWLTTHTSEKVLRIAATATASGIRTAGSVPNTNSSTTSAPMPPIAASAAQAPAAAAGLRLAGLAERVAAGDVDRHAGREPALGRGLEPLGAAEDVEARRPGRIDDRERRPAVRGDVHRAPGREERARAGAGHHVGGAPDRGLHARAAGHVTARVEDDDVGRAIAGAERRERPLAGLVGGRAGDRRALVPARLELPAGDRAHEREQDPGADHLPAVTRREQGEAGEERAGGGGRHMASSRMDLTV